MSFMDICGELGSGVIVVALVAVLANIAIAKAFSTEKSIDATQEMLTLGLCNIIGSCLSSMPTSGAFSRSALSNVSGIKTPMAGMYSALMVVLSLSLLSPYFYYIPTAALSAVLICAIVFMIDYNICMKLWRNNRLDFYAWLTCLIVCLTFGVEFGLLVGVLLSICYLLYHWARPVMITGTLQIDENQCFYIVPSLGLYYTGVERLREHIQQLVAKRFDKVVIIVECDKLHGMDYTTVKVLVTLASNFKKSGHILILSNLKSDNQNLFSAADNIVFYQNGENRRDSTKQQDLPPSLIERIKEELNMEIKLDRT